MVIIKIYEGYIGCNTIRRAFILYRYEYNNSVPLVSERTIPTERLPLVSEVRANFCGQRVSRG
jgi:hypothetical protein